MELVNNRYRIIKCIKQTRMVSSYIAADMMNNYREIVFNIMSDEFLPDSIIKYYSEEFLSISELSNCYLLRNYDFNIVSYIDNKKQHKILYFYTSEYQENTGDILSIVQNMSFYEKLDLFIQLCTGINYLHLKGITYGELNLSNIIVTEERNKTKLRLNDIATVELEKYSFKSEDKDNLFMFNRGIEKYEGNSKICDIYALGVVLLLFLIGKKIKREDIYSELKNLNEAKNDENISKIYPVLEKLLCVNGEYPYNCLQDLINELNNLFNKNYVIFNYHELEKINFRTKLVDRKDEMEMVLKAYDNMINNKQGKKFFLFHGEAGTGKTRFFEEIRFLLTLKNANIYSSFSLNNQPESSNNMWIDLLRKLIVDGDPLTISKYEVELTKYFPEIADRKRTIKTENISLDNAKYRLLNRIAAFISDSVKNKPVVFIIDNIHYANDFSIDTFAYLFNDIVLSNNIMFIFSYRQSDMNNNERLRNFIHIIYENKRSAISGLRDFNSEQTTLMVKYMLSIPILPYYLSKVIHTKTYGNPLFINEIVKNLFNQKDIYINEEGRWFSKYSRDTYDNMPIPNSMEQVLLNQINDSHTNEYEILKVISIFTNTVSTCDISIMAKIDISDTEKLVEELVFKGILTRKIGDNGYLFGINNKVLKDIVYSKIDPLEKIEKHKVASEILEAEYKKNIYSNVDELIFHLEKANINDKLKIYCIESAEKMEKLKNRSSQIKYLEKALITINDNEIIEKLELILKLGRLYNDNGERSKTLHFYDEYEGLANNFENKRYLVMIYVHKASIFFEINEIKNVECYIEKIGNLIDKIDYKECYLDYKRLQVTLSMYYQKYKEAETMAYEILELAGDDFFRIKSEVYRVLGVIYLYSDRIQQAIEYFNNSIEFADKADNISLMLSALNNIGATYAEYYQDYDKALNYFNKIKEICDGNNFLDKEMYVDINISEMYYAKMEYTKACEYLLIAIDKAQKLNHESNLFYCYNQMTKSLIELDNYKDAYYYNKLAEKELENFPDQGREISEYYRGSSDLFFIFGEFAVAEKYSKKAIKIYGSEESILNLQGMANMQYINFISKSIETLPKYVNKLIDISRKFVSPERRIKILLNGAITLYDSKQFDLSLKLYMEAQKSMNCELNDYISALYQLVTGLVTNIDNKLEAFFNGFRIAKIVKNKKLVAYISIAIGDYYYSRGNYFYAANYYIEACGIIKEFIFQIPDKYRVRFTNFNKYIKPFKRVEYIRNKYIKGDLAEEEENVELKSYFVSSYKELLRIINEDETKAFLGNNDFILSIRKLYMSYLPNGVYNEKDILTSLSKDNIKNIELIIKYLSAATLATSGVIVTEDANGSIKTIAALNESQKLPDNLSIFERAKANVEPILLLDKDIQKENDMSLLSDEIKACICMPIYDRSYLSDNDVKRVSINKVNIIGYLYLESDRVLNNFNSNGLQMCKELSLFLYLLLEKHQLKISASIDKLTGALTRKYLEESLVEQIEYAEQSKTNFSIIMYDLDKFKNVNDRYGHQTGDEVLKNVSRIVLRDIGKENILGRYGGEEFIIVLPSAVPDKAFEIAEKIRKNIMNEKILGEKTDITVSMGIASFPLHGYWKHELIEKADQALYVAKENGRNRCQIWESKFSKKVQGTNKLNGIISGNAVEDSRNVLVLVELIQLVRENKSNAEKIYSFLGRIIEIFEAQYGMFMMVNNSQVTESYCRKAFSEEHLDIIDYNESSINKVIKNKQGVYMIDWDYVGTHDLLTNIPDWYSILVVPIFVNDSIKGIIYLSVSTRIKEFGFDEFNFLTVIGDLIANIL